MSNPPVHKLAEFQIHRLADRIEAATEMHWYARDGYYKVSIVGFGRNEKLAKQAAMDMAIRARTELHFATIDDVSSRVPETPAERANERSEHRAQCPEGTTQVDR